MYITSVFLYFKLKMENIIHIYFRLFLFDMTGKKINLYRLLRQVETKAAEREFLFKHNLLPREVQCPGCDSKLVNIYPVNNPNRKFKYFRCSCNSAVKIPLTKNTIFSDLRIREGLKLFMFVF